MKSKILTRLITIIGFIPLFSVAQTAGNGGFVKLGVSQINITPGQPVMMSGYAARKTPSTGIHDSLFASALFFSDAQNKALIITADVIGFQSVFVDSLKKMISEKTGVPPDRIMIAALHNHG